MTKYPMKKAEDGLPDVANAKLQAIAKNEGIPPEGLTILGGKVYVNVTGLDRKLQNKCREEGLIFKGIKLNPVWEKTDVEKCQYAYRAEVLLFDQKGFMDALSKCSDITPEVVDALTRTFTFSFPDEGVASPDTCEAIAYEYQYDEKIKRKVKGKLLVENVIMMASRRATNRAKREATGTGLTSVDELPGSVLNGHVSSAPQGKPPTTPPRAKKAPEKPKESNPEDEEIRDKISAMLIDIATSPDEIPSLIEQYSAFQGSKGEVVSRSNLNNLAGKWLMSVYGKVKADWTAAGFAEDGGSQIPEGEDDVPA